MRPVKSKIEYGLAQVIKKTERSDTIILGILTQFQTSLNSLFAKLKAVLQQS
jgi:hypothetical protein